MQFSEKCWPLVGHPPNPVLLTPSSSPSPLPLSSTLLPHPFNHSFSQNLIVRPPHFYPLSSLLLPLLLLYPQLTFHPPTLHADLVPAIGTFVDLDGIGFEGVVALAACCFQVGVGVWGGGSWKLGGRHLGSCGEGEKF